MAGEELHKMGPIGRALVNRLARGDEARDGPDWRRTTYAVLEGWVSIGVNTFLFAVKLVVGLLTGSVALIADAIHSFSDSLTSIVVIVGARMARRPADADHPFGHGRVEGIATITCAVLLAVTAIEFGKASVDRILNPVPIDATYWAIAVVVLTIPVKEWLARFARALGRVSGNTTLEAEFWHHRSDALSTAVVVIGMVSSRFGLNWVDGVVGLVVCFLLLKVAYDIARSAVDNLLGRGPDEEEVEDLADRALSVQGVRSVHDIVVHHYGANRFISLHVETSASATPEELHELAEEVERQVAGDQHGSVCVHVDPVDRRHAAYRRIEVAVRRVVGEDEVAVSFHDLRISDAGEGGGLLVRFDVNVSPESTEEAAETAARLMAAVKAAEQDVSEVAVDVEPPYAYPAKRS